MRIGILSDAHIGHRKTQISSLKYTIDQLLKLKVDLIVDCGDITDNNIINATQATELYDIFKDIDIPYHLVRGNHDTLNNTTVASLLGVNKNIIIHNNIDKFEYNNNTFLFVPYTDNIKELYKNLDKIISKQYNFVFSHLNITNNLYASIPFSETKKLHLYGDIWFNGHIHTPEENKTIYGNIYNVGSVSSLTYGDEHVPNYCIFNTETKELIHYTIPNSIIHKTVYDIEKFDFNTFINMFKDYKINWRIKLPNNFYIEERMRIKDKLQSFNNTNEIQFDYIKADNKINKNIINKNNKNKISLLQQLIQQYEKDTKEILLDDIKKELEEYV